jgi:hypothetical protein
MNPDKFSLLKKVLKAIGLSEERIEELIGWIQTWLQDDSDKKSGEALFPYRLQDNFLSPAERSFYGVLGNAVGDWAVVAPKVGLGDLFYAQTGDHRQNRVYRNKIDRKHVDFLLCDVQTLQPILGVELDDKSHQREDRRDRDRFVDRVFEASGLPIAHIPARQAYQAHELGRLLREKAGPSPMPGAVRPAADSSAAANAPGPPTCPKCGSAMTLRTARSGPRAGNKFWGCTTYPKCQGIVAYVEAN